jgi:hypothetical protein
MLLWVFISSVYLQSVFRNSLDIAANKDIPNTNPFSSSAVSPRIQFIFVVGLEGTGHHLMGRIIQNSPAFHQFKHYSGLEDYRQAMKALHLSLFDKAHGTGLWNLPCDCTRNVTKTNRSSRSVATTSTHHDEEQEHRLEQVAEILKRIQTQHSAQATSSTVPPVVSFPVNTITVDKDDKNSFGQASYPNFGGGCCRLQQYPRLNLFYRACAMANVDCRHVYLYRDPYQILYSTTIHRTFNVNLAQGVALYQRLLSDVLLPELTVYSDHSLGCLGFYEQLPVPSSFGDDNDNISGTFQDHHDWQRAIQKLWQWRNATKFKETIDRIYHPPSSSQHRNATTDIHSSLMTQLEDDHTTLSSSSSLAERETVFSMMEKWKRAHQRLLQLCSEQEEEQPQQRAGSVLLSR